MSSRKPDHRVRFSDPGSAGRQKRADALRRRALSPVRILLMILMLPVTTAVIATGVFIRTSEFEHQDALVHLIALAGCKTVEAVVPGPFLAGEPGYHLRNDPEGDGVACGSAAPPPDETPSAPRVETPRQRTVGTAKFIKP